MSFNVKEVSVEGNYLSSWIKSSPKFGRVGI